MTSRTLIAMGGCPSAKLISPTRLSQERQQAAAVCYRVSKRGVEFLLVQTRGGRWIFPKGGVEPDLTHAESAALEAFEEAGVHGRMERIPFARYFRYRPSKAARSELPVMAHLCEVSWLEPPQESKRNPTWFSAEKAKRRLAQGRAPEFGADLARVVDRALARIQRLHGGTQPSTNRTFVDGLQKVRVEAHDDGHGHHALRETALARYILRQPHVRTGAVIEGAAQSPTLRVLQIEARRQMRQPFLRLSSGANVIDTTRNISAIDASRKVNPPHLSNRAPNKRKSTDKLGR
jgi:8-oxo-dGTP pyrophosphatase MutT (NUDIX family)